MQIYGQIQENELRSSLRLIWQRRWWLILSTIIGCAIALVASQLMTRTYQASSTLLINEAPANVTASYQDILANERVSRTYAELLMQRPILEETAAQLGMSIEAFESEISAIRVTPVRDTQLIRIVVEGESPELVAMAANTLPYVFIDRIQEVQSARYRNNQENLQTQLTTLDNEIQGTLRSIETLGEPETSDQEALLVRLQDLLAQYRSSYATILSRFEELRLIEAQSVDSITVMETAETPEEAIRPRVLLNTVLGLMIGALLALGAIFLLEYIDDRFRSPQDLTTVLGTVWMGSITKIPGIKAEQWDSGNLITAKEPRHPISESFRRLRTNLQFSSVDRDLRSILITSTNPSEGKSLTSANLAAVLAQSGRSVVLVDADLHKPVQHKIFGVSSTPGLADALINKEANITDFLRQTPTPNLRLLTCGSRAPNPAELVGSARMQNLLDEMANSIDIVVIDAPPVLAVTDAQVLGRLVSGTLLVIDAGKTTRHAALQAVTALRQVGGVILGAVLNRVTKSTGAYYYHHYDQYYTADEVEEGNPPQQTPQPAPAVESSSITKS